MYVVKYVDSLKEQVVITQVVDCLINIQLLIATYTKVGRGWAYVPWISYLINTSKVKLLVTLLSLIDFSSHFTFIF